MNTCANMQLYSINILYLLAVFQNHRQFMGEFHEIWIIFQLQNKIHYIKKITFFGIDDNNTF